MISEWLRRQSPSAFLNKQEKEKLLLRISEFENLTHCELVIHFKRNFKGDPLQDNQRLFQKHQLDRTPLKNAILLTLAIAQRQFAIWADEGVAQNAPKDLWDQISERLSHSLREEKRLEGLLACIDLLEKRISLKDPNAKRESNALNNEPLVDDE